MKASADLSRARILIADPDMEMARVLQVTLGRMGFTSVTIVRNGRQALEIIDRNEIDILVTEWAMEGLDGISLIRSIRKEYGSPQAMLPIIMLTGRARRDDVKQARDCGVSEFVVKPFTSATLFKHIQKIFDSPCDFVVTPTYSGPDRRRRQSDDQPSDNRRKTAPILIPSQALPWHDPSVPSKVRYERNLHKRIGLKDKISSLITPEVLQQAQAAIESFSDDSKRWIADDLKQMDAAFEQLQQHEQQAVKSLMQLTLSVKSRAGTFGHKQASEVAFTLYLFLRQDYISGNISHRTIIRKHIDALRVLLAGNVIGQTALQSQLVNELVRMTEKLKYERA